MSSRPPRRRIDPPESQNLSYAHAASLRAQIEAHKNTVGTTARVHSHHVDRARATLAIRLIRGPASAPVQAPARVDGRPPKLRLLASELPRGEAARRAAHLCSGNRRAVGVARKWAG